MQCILLPCCHSLFSPSISVPKYNNQQPCITKLSTFATNVRYTNPNEFLNYKHNSGSLKTKALSGTTSTSLVTGLTSSARPVDINVLVITSAVFLFVYWIANFVVPDMLIKDFQSDKTGEDQKFVDED